MTGPVLAVGRAKRFAALLPALLLLLIVAGAPAPVLAQAEQSADARRAHGGRRVLQAAQRAQEDLRRARQEVRGQRQDHRSPQQRRSGAQGDRGAQGSRRQAARRGRRQRHVWSLGAKALAPRRRQAQIARAGDALQAGRQAVPDRAVARPEGRDRSAPSRSSRARARISPSCCASCRRARISSTSCCRSASTRGRSTSFTSSPTGFATPPTS